MRIVSCTLGIFGLLLLSLPLLLLFVVLENEADYPTDQQVNSQQLNELQDLLVNNGPALLVNSSVQRLLLNEAETNAVFTYLLGQVPNDELSWLLGQAGLIELASDSVTVEGSLALEPTLFGSYLNFSAGFVEHENSLSLQHLQIASLSIPAFIYRPLLSFTEQQVSKQSDYIFVRSMMNSIQTIDLDKDFLALGINWEAENISSLQEQARQLLIDPATRDRLIRYQRQLLTVLSALPESDRSISLNKLLSPLFVYATNSQEDPRDENRAIFQILSCYLLSELALEDLLGPEALTLETDAPLRVTIESRDDLPRHLIASAAIAASADDDLANILSVYKEVQDSRTSSGFSFSDMTANLVGTRLGVLSSNSRADALRLQRFFTELSSEEEYMPRVGPPDGISEVEFVRRYETRSSEAYQQRLNEIEASIEQLAVFQ